MNKKQLLLALNAKNEAISAINNKIQNAETADEIIELSENKAALQAERDELEAKLNTTGNVTDVDYLATNAAVTAFAKLMLNSKNKDELKTKWNEHLVENGLTITDPNQHLPKVLLSEIKTVLTNEASLLSWFRVTSAGAILVTREYSDSTEAKVHIGTAQKDVSDTSLKVSNISPRAIYKRMQIEKLQATITEKFGDIYTVIVKGAVERIVAKIIDLALVEGTSTGNEEDAGTEKDNGFMSIMNEKDASKVVTVPGKTDLLGAIETAVDSVNNDGRRTVLIVTREQKNNVLKAVRTANPNVRIPSDLEVLASEVGVDHIHVYRGTKALSPIVLAEGAYAVDMTDFDRVEQFKIDNNTHDILVETFASGRMVDFEGAAVIDLKK